MTALVTSAFFSEFLNRNVTITNTSLYSLFKQQHYNVSHDGKLRKKQGRRLASDILPFYHSRTHARTHTHTPNITDINLALNLSKYDSHMLPELDMDWIHPWIGLGFSGKFMDWIGWVGWLWPRFLISNHCSTENAVSFKLWSINLAIHPSFTTIRLVSGT